MAKKLTTEEFIERAINVHGELYDYSKSNYTTGIENVCIVCSKHGSFYQKPAVHLRGAGCPECGRIKMNVSKPKSQEWFLYRAKCVHGDKYDYSMSKYDGVSVPIEIICPTHGSFWQTPNCHLEGRGCRKCGHISTGEKVTLTTDEFIFKANVVHQNKYTYDRTVYITNKKKVIITCPTHGDFTQSPFGHLTGNGCMKCFIDTHIKSRSKTTELFIEQSKAVHGDSFSYEDVEYVSGNTPVKLYCNTHNGVFYQNPRNNVRGHGCAICNTSMNLFKKKEWIRNAKNKLGCFYIIECYN